MKPTFLMLLSLMLMMSCQSSKQLTGEKTSLYKQWVVATLNGRDIQQLPVTVYLSLDKAASRVSGKSGCNRFFGTFAISGNKLTFSKMGSTRMLCDEESNRIENEFIKMISNVNGYRLNGEKLVLLSDDTELATLVAGHDAPDDLVGKWELSDIPGSKAVLSELYPNNRPFILFKTESRDFAANTGCNTMTGSYNGPDSTTLFKPGISTLMACPGDGEKMFVTRLQQADSYQIADGKLILFRKKKPLLEFIKSTSL